MDIKIGNYRYKADQDQPQLGTFYIQGGYGTEEAVIRKFVYNWGSIVHMFEVFEKTGYYTIDKIYGFLKPLTWTDDPRILAELEITELPKPEPITYAILRPNEEAGHISHNKLYQFKYDERDNFFIFVNGNWEVDHSTAFDFISVAD